MEKIKVGILGAGNIAVRMAKTANLLEETEAYAIASRSQEKAEAFAAENGVKRAYGSYEAMLNDPDVDLVYVALPHSHHYAWGKAALLAGKHVLAEKAFTENGKQARELFALAEERGLFCGEAMWSRFVPGADVLRGLKESGKIGKVCSVQVTFGENMWHIERIWNPHLAGGALLDVGVYALAFASLALGGDVEKVESFLDLSELGVDRQDAILMKMKSGEIASLYISCLAKCPTECSVIGTDGKAFTDNMWDYGDIRILAPDGTERERILSPVEHNGFEYELRDAVSAIREGKTEFGKMTHKETLRIMDMMDEIRARAGMTYPDE